MYDLPNNNIRVNGKVRIINFNILSETYEGRRLLNLHGFDELGNEYTATGWFDRSTYILKVKFLQSLTEGWIMTEDGQIITGEDGLKWKVETQISV